MTDRAARIEGIRRECALCEGGDDPRINRYHAVSFPEVRRFLDELARLKRKRRRRRNQRNGRTA